MKIVRVTKKNRLQAFEVATRRGAYLLPYSEVSPSPSSDDPLVDVYVDSELGCEGFTYRLASGAEGSVHVDAVLEYNKDPSYMGELAVYRLSLEARRRFDAGRLSARELARRLGTSPTQLYRLLDTSNSTKSFKQLVALLHVLGAEVEVVVQQRDRLSATSETHAFSSVDRLVSLSVSLGRLPMLEEKFNDIAAA